MSSVELWFDDDEDEDDRHSSFLQTLRRRRQLRDASNPLELEDSIFVKNFRLSKSAFSYILNEIDGKLKPSFRSTSIPNVIKLAAALRLCAHGAYQISVGNDHSIGLAQSTVSLTLKSVFNALETFICPKWMNFNYTNVEKIRAKKYFLDQSGIPGVIGCVDGTHIRIASPKKQLQHAYHNSKGFYSLNAMIVCDEAMTIRFFNAKYPGASHDTDIFNMSSLKMKMEEEYQSGERNTWLLGDCGYELKPYLLTPFRNPEAASRECLFNTKHAKAMKIVERTIGVLKNRFRCLLRARELHYSPEKATQIANVCAALHNICIAFNIPPPEEFEDDIQEEDETNSYSSKTSHPNEFSESEAAIEIRNRILRTL